MSGIEKKFEFMVEFSSLISMSTDILCHYPNAAILKLGNICGINRKTTEADI
jgi:hypothetical protein